MSKHCQSSEPPNLIRKVSGQTERKPQTRVAADDRSQAASRRYERPPSVTLARFLPALVALLMTACATPRAQNGSSGTGSPLRDVRFEKIQEIPGVADQARELAARLYPKLILVLNDDPDEAPPTFHLIVRKDLQPLEKAVQRRTQQMPKLASARHPAAAHATTIYLAASSLETNRAAFEQTFGHEMAHIAARPHWRLWSNDPVCWSEGLADYAAYKVLSESSSNPPAPPKCSMLFPHYSCGYGAAAAFLLYLEQTYSPAVIRHLTATLRRHRYSEAFFREETGKDLELLWQDFLKTNGVSPFARRMNALYTALGFKNGTPPSDAETRFTAWALRQPEGDLMKENLDQVYIGEKRAADIYTRIAAWTYLTRPGGSPVFSLLRLLEQGTLPGIAKGEQGSLSEPFTLDQIDKDEPLRECTVKLQKTGDTTVYHFEMIREGESSDWTWRKLWRTAPDGRLLDQPQATK